MNTEKKRLISEVAIMAPIPIKLSRATELVDQYPAVKENLELFFSSESFHVMFSDMMEFVNSQRVWLGISEEEIENSRDIFLDNVKVNTKLNVLVNAISIICTQSGKLLEDIGKEMIKLTEKNYIEEFTKDYMEGLKRNAETMIASMLSDDGIPKYTS